MTTAIARRIALASTGLRAGHSLATLRAERFPAAGRGIAARKAKLALRADARREVETAVADHAADVLQEAARAELAIVIEKWEGVPITWQNIDRAQFELTAASKAAGYSAEARAILKDRICGPRCDGCGFRGCSGHCRDIDEDRYGPFGW